MKKKLLAVGDSFTWGDELEDRSQAWPSLVAGLLDYEVNNMGLNGASNTSILRITLEELAINHYDQVVIGWSSPGRTEWKDPGGKPYNVWPGLIPAPGVWATEPWRRNLIEYINRHHDSGYLYQMYLTYVISLQSYLQVHNINYRMIDVASTNYYRTAGGKQHDKLEAMIDTKYFIGWKNFGMYELAYDCPRGPGRHPLEQGHIKIATAIHQSLQ